jgi:hypothetical protein
MPFIYERPVSERVTFLHRVTWLDTVLWAVWQVLKFLVFALVWVVKGIVKGILWLCLLVSVIPRPRAARVKLDDPWI